MQYDLFETEEISAIRLDCAQLRQSQSNMRRGLFARHGELQKAIEELRNEMQELKQIQAKKKAELVPFFGELMEITR